MSIFNDEQADVLNPIFLNDLRKTRRYKLFWFNLAFLLLVYSVVFYFLLSASSFKSDSYILDCYRVLAFFFLIAFAVIPMEVRYLTINELDKNNIFLIFMSNITAGEFIKGKLQVGLFYIIALFIAVIPVNLFIYFVGAIDFYRLMRISFYTLIIPIPLILLFIFLGLNDSRGGKIVLYINGLLNLVGVLFLGFFFIEIGVYTIRDAYETSVFSLVVADLIAFAVIFIITIFLRLFIISCLTRLYPMSDSDASFVSNSKGFNFRIRKDALIEKINLENETKSSNNIDIDENNNPLKEEESDKKVIKPIKTIKPIKPIELTSIRSELNDFRSKEFFIINKDEERISNEAKIKGMFTGIWLFSLLLALFDTDIGFILLYIGFCLLPFIALYFHSRDAIYDNKSKLEIPPAGVKRYIKFPFVSGYANGVIWLAIMCLLLLIVLNIKFGIMGKPSRSLNGLCDGGYYVLIGSMLNIFAWCFLGRFIADKLDIKEDPGENKVLTVIALLMLVTFFCTGLIPKTENSLYNQLNYFLPNMPSLTSYFFFDNYKAFLYNLIFFAVTIIPNLKTLVKQTKEYFNYVPDSDINDSNPNNPYNSSNPSNK